MTELDERRGQKQRQREHMPKSVPILAAVVAVLLVIKGILSLLGLPGEDSQQPEEIEGTPETPDWIEQDFLPQNPYSRPGTLLEEVNGVVVHYVGNPNTTAQQNHDYFAGLAQQTQEPYTSVSSHFLIGLEGEIIQNIPLDEIAYCSYPRNGDTISIECCHPDETGEFNQETYDALIKLVRWLKESYRLETSQILRHYDVIGKDCPRYFVQHPETWEAFLEDLEEPED